MLHKIHEKNLKKNLNTKPHWWLNDIGLCLIWRLLNYFNEIREQDKPMNWTAIWKHKTKRDYIPCSVRLTSETEHNTRVPMTASTEASRNGKDSETCMKPSSSPL